MNRSANSRLSHSGHPIAPGPAAPSDELPAPPTRLLGRARELESIGATLQGPDVRLLTLTGPGGIGKTRLALEITQRTRASFPGGVFFVSLGELKDASLVAPELAKSIGVVETGANLEELLAKSTSGVGKHSSSWILSST